MSQTQPKTLSNIKNFLEEISVSDQGKDVEKNIFSIGAKGYYENPTSDMLAFFCDTDEVHGLGSFILEALFNCLIKDNYLDYDFSLLYPPKREVFTHTQKRIDLILEGENWVIVLENKIYHSSNNPFKEYEEFIENSHNFRNKKIIYILLSPHGRGTSDGKWQGVKYNYFIEQIKSNIAPFIMNQPFNKWFFLLREFILHLEQLMSKPTLPQETIDFVLNNLSKIKEVEKLRDKTIPIYHESLQKKLQENLEQNIGIKLDFWHEKCHALRFFYPQWKDKFESNSNVTLFLDSRPDKQFGIFYYAHKICNNEDRYLADTYLQENDVSSTWDEGKKTIRCYQALLENLDNDYLIKKLMHKLQIMDAFEKKRNNNITY